LATRMFVQARDSLAYSDTAANRPQISGNGIFIGALLHNREFSKPADRCRIFKRVPRRITQSDAGGEPSSLSRHHSGT
jgi:hypothetical protein